MKRRLKAKGFIIFSACLAAVLFPRIFFRAASEDGLFNKAVEISGVLLILAGQLFRASARGYKSEYSRDSLKLVTGGPYTLTRNPMYFGIFLIGLGMILALFRWWAFMIFLLVFAFSYLRLIRHEEAKLLAAFPGEYAVYQKQAPRFFPSPKILFSHPIQEVLPLKRRWLIRESGSIIAVLAALLLLKAWQYIAMGGK